MASAFLFVSEDQYTNGLRLAVNIVANLIYIHEPEFMASQGPQKNSVKTISSVGIQSYRADARVVGANYDNWIVPINLVFMFILRDDRCRSMISFFNAQPGRRQAWLGASRPRPRTDTTPRNKTRAATPNTAPPNPAIRTSTGRRPNGLCETERRRSHSKHRLHMFRKPC